MSEHHVNAIALQTGLLVLEFSENGENNAISIE